MKRRIFSILLAALFAALTPASASADWKQWVKNRIPPVQVSVPNLMSRTGQPAVSVGIGPDGAYAQAGTGVRRMVSDDAVLAEERHRTPPAASQSGVGRPTIIRSGASDSAPDFRGTVVAISWFGTQGGPVRVERNIWKELSKRGGDLVLDSGTDNPCLVAGEPAVICFTVSEPVAVSHEGGHDQYSGSNRRERGTWGSSDRSSDASKRYAVAVRAFLVRSDGSEPLLLAEKVESFSVTESRRENWSWRSSNKGRYTSSSGSRSTTLEKGIVFGAARSEAIRKAEGAIKYLLKEKSRKDWLPGGADEVADAFRRQPAGTNYAD